MGGLYFLLKWIVAINMSKYWNDVFQNALGCAIGSAVPIGISFYIFWLTNRHNRRVAEREKLADQINLLEAFKVMLQRVINTSDILVKNIGEFIPKLGTHPNVFPLLKIVSVGHFKRLIGTITFEETGAAYTKLLPSPDSINEFTSILEIVDYLYDAFGELKETTKKALLNHEERIFKVSDLYDDMDKFVIDNIEILGTESPLMREMGKIKSNQSKNMGEKFNDVDGIYNYYFLPMRDLMAKLKEDGFVNDFTRKFTYKISVGIEYYSYLDLGYSNFISELTEMNKSLKEHLEKLKFSAEKILHRDFKKRI
jgi:hypothetical protein